MKPNGHATVDISPLLAADDPEMLRRDIAPTSRRRRDALTFTAKVTGHKIHLGITTDAHGKPVKVKIDVHKAGAPFRSVMRTVSELTTLALKGRALADVVDVLCDGEEPLVMVEDHDSKVLAARSIPDFVGRVIASEWPHLMRAER